MVDILVALPLLVILLLIACIVVSLPVLLVWFTREIIRDWRDGDIDGENVVLIIFVDILIFSLYLGLFGKALGGNV